MSNYSLGAAARILKVSPARLRYWERTDLVRTQGDARTSDGFEFRDLVRLRGVLALLEKGISLRRIRRIVESLRERLPELDEPLGSLRLWAEGSDRIVIRQGDALIEPDGQTVLNFESKSATGVGAPDVRSLAREAEQQGAPSALDWFERGCELDGDPRTLAEALEAYERALEIEPRFADCHCNLGAIHYNRGDRSQARRCFERCLELDARHVEAHFNLANLLEEEGREELALRHYRVALEEDSLYPDLHINLALLYEKRGGREQALYHWRVYLQIDANGTWADVARQRLEDGA